MKARLVLAAAAVCAGLGSAAAPAGAEPGRLADFSLGFTTASPGAPTGLNVHVLLHRAGDPDAKPSPLRSAVIRGPAGLRFDTTTVTECNATDDQLRTLGSDACPHDSELTVGQFSAMTGFGPPADPIAGDDHVFNGPNQLIEVITNPGGPASPAFDRLKISGSTLTAHPPVAPGGPPEGESAVRSLDFQVPVRTARGKSLITTPPGCPSEGHWTTTAKFDFADGSTDTVASPAPCASPALRLQLRPKRVRAGRRIGMSISVGSTSAACISGATVRLAGRTAQTDRRGRATLTTTFRHVGIRRAQATKPGCGAGSAPLRILGG